MKHEPFNESTEMYLKTVSELAEGDEAVPISALAKRLGVSTVSATEMVHRLQDQDLLEHVPYKGIHLTDEGSRRALGVIRSHQLWETFLADFLQLPWEDVHEYACRLEHATDGAVTEALNDFLGRPARCPHGNPVPQNEDADSAISATPLSDLEPGQAAAIDAIHPESTLLLQYLADRNLKPGVWLTVREIAPFNGPVMVAVDDEVHALGREVAAQIFVRIAAAGETPRHSVNRRTA